jgi:hypothetical protein
VCIGSIDFKNALVKSVLLFDCLIPVYAVRNECLEVLIFEGDIGEFIISCPAYLEIKL